MKGKKFRGRIKGTKEWRFWDEFGRIGEGSTVNPSAFDEDTVGQYAELEDKHESEIFEGDVLRVRSRKTETLCVVVFREGWFIGITEDNSECEFRYMADVEVIGNIYDNPDLIKIRPQELKEED